MTSKLTTLAQKRRQNGPSNGRESLDWLEDKISKLSGRSNIASQLAREPTRWVDRFRVGGLYFFYYDPKTKTDLPYYDRFPLVIPVSIENDSFLGLNLHYLPVRQRMVFLDKMFDLAVLNKYDEIARVRISYDILTASNRFKEYKVCLKRYLLSNVRSKIIAVQPNEWDIASMLPVQQFKKQTPQIVWEESVEKMRTS